MPNNAIVTRSNKANRVFGDYTRNLTKKVYSGLQAAGEYLKERSLTIVPRDTETLASTARVSHLGSLLNNMVVIVGYGGSDFPEVTVYSKKEQKMVKRKPSEYAVYVHEMIGKAHDKGQSYEFLAIPLRTERLEISMAFERGFHGP